MADDGDVVEIRPNRAIRAVQFLALILPLTAGSAYMITSPNWYIKALGMFGVGLFGIGGVWALSRMTRTRGPTWVLSPKGLARRSAPDPALIPWPDVEAIGYARIQNNRMAAIRLRSYDAYLASMTSGPTGTTPINAAAFLAGALTMDSALLDASRLRGPAKWLAWNRQHTGYDIAFAWNELDRPKAAFVALLQSYLDRYGAAPHPIPGPAADGESPA